MKTIIYYISDYGYGHASRSIAIIREILKTSKHIKIMICHSYALPFLKSSLQDERVTFHEVSTDIGYFLKGNSIQPDREKLNEEYNKYISGFEDTVQAEIANLKGLIPDLVISDISPLAFEIADKLGVPSVGISNFTWYTAYQELLKVSQLETLKRAYGKMDYFFSLAGSMEPNWGKKDTVHFGFYSREVNSIKVIDIRRSLNLKSDEFIVYVGLGMKINDIDLSELPIWNNPKCKFIVSSNIEIEKPNDYKIPRDYTETQNYIAAADLVITKAGWGTVSEAIVSGTPLLLLERDSMAEDKNTIQYLKERELCSTIKWDKLNSLEIETYLKKPIIRSINIENDVSEIVGKLLSILNNND